MVELARVEYSIERKVWNKIVNKHDLFIELMAAFEKRDQRFIFDLVKFCEEHGVKLSEVNRREIRKVEEKVSKDQSKHLKLRILK